MTDHGPHAYITNIERETLENTNYRTTLWTGKNIQVTLMTIQPGHDIGLEVHEDHDQFLRIEAGKATVYTGSSETDLDVSEAGEDDVVLVPAGTWHNLVNSGEEPLKLYSIYGPPEHAHGTVHKTKEIADADEHDH
ncbi:cupin [Candidatus Saccharibacteria bacterium]|nr:cupin [Candidatus Saccharibacteria bacterium]MBJ58439.1 cupin [Candidatus Saccharibacteria bacterium]MBQ69570.1 cupin [Candidatus Saccharibacteria bacterium]|tara:strand:+ start:779 stop:1186 length:408 start_codon:yes stop_codon:yes gene_type:complete